jgi:DNA-binding LytR/AlgR family response regulator
MGFEHLRVLIVDDEPLALDRLERLLRTLGVREIYRAENAYQAKDLLVSNPDIQVVFLDIKMPGKDGLEFAKELIPLREDLMVVMQTAYEEYALSAYKSGAIAYLVKPYTAEELGKLLNRLLSYRGEVARIMVYDKNQILKSFPVSEVYYIKAELKHSLCRTKEGLWKCIKGIGELEERLKKMGFFRIHKSYLVNLAKVSRIEHAEMGKLLFYFDDINEKILSSKSGAKAFRDLHKDF